MTRVRIAVVGAGWWSTAVHMPALRADRDIELVGVVDPSPYRRAAAVEEFGIPRAFSELGELLAEGSADGVIIATPHDTHAGLVEQCLRAGVDVLVEKPMATTAEDAWRIVDLERASTARVVVGLTYQFAAQANEVRMAVRERIGDLVSVNAEFSSGTEFLFQIPDEADPDLGAPVSPPRKTYSDPATGGGQGFTQLSHLLGGVLWAAGDQATDVSAFMATRGVRVDVVDALAFRLAGGGLGVASSTGTTPATVPVRHQIRFHGTRGMVEWDMLQARVRVYETGGCVRHLDNPPDRAAYGAATVSVQFAHTIAGGGRSPAPSDAAAASISLIEAAYRAAESGQRTRVVQGPLRP